MPRPAPKMRKPVTVGPSTTGLGQGYAEAESAGVGVSPGGAPASTKKLVQGASKGFVASTVEGIKQTGRAIGKAAHFVMNYNPYAGKGKQ